MATLPKPASAWLASPRLETTIGLLVLCVACFRFVSPLSRSADLGLYDEANYLAWGVQFLGGGSPPAPDCGPLYCLWYGILDWVSIDRAATYFLSYALTAITPPLLIFAIARKLGTSSILALGASLWFLWSQANLPVWPRVNHFCLILALAGLWLATLCPSRRMKLAALSITTLLMAYCRPEHAITWLIAITVWMVTVALTLKKDRWTGGEFALAGIALVGSATALSVFGWPLGHGRDMMAFGQHFGIHWCRWTGSTLDNWDDWQQILNVSFGPVHSLGQAAVSNPLLMARHIVGNLYSLLATGPHLLMPSWWRGDGISALAVLVALTIQAWLVRKPLLSACCKPPYSGLLPAIMLPASLASVLLIFPRSHYLTLPLVLGALGLLVVLGRTSAGQRSQGALLQPLSASLALLLALAWPPYEAVDKGQPHLKAVQRLQSLIASGPAIVPRILDSEGGFALFLENSVAIPHVEKQADFASFRSAANFNVIVVSPKLLSDLRFSQDPLWIDFLDHPEKSGFSVFPVAETPFRVMIQHSLLRSPQ